jgi:hypothetical protein
MNNNTHTDRKSGSDFNMSQSGDHPVFQLDRRGYRRNQFCVFVCDSSSLTALTKQFTTVNPHNIQAI